MSAVVERIVKGLKPPADERTHSIGRSKLEACKPASYAL